MVRNAFLVLALLASAPAQAQSQMVKGQSPQSVVEALQAGGYKAILNKDSTGDPRIESAASGSRFFLNFYGCKDNVNCTTITFYAGWSGVKVTLEQINNWNTNKRFSRAYLDKDGDPVIEFDVDLDDGGMSQDLFVDNVQFFENSIGGFKKHIGL